MKHTGGGIMSILPNSNLGYYLYVTYFENQDTGFFIECGATDGFCGSVCHALEYGCGWTGINVEANKYWIDDLNEKRPNCTNIHAALWDKNGTETLTLPQYKKDFKFPGGASLVMWSEKVLKDNDLQYSESFEVETITYHTMCEKNKVQKVDLMVLDVEGAELQVLDGMEWDDPLPRYLYIERDKVDETELLSRMGSLGYSWVTGDTTNGLYKRGK